MKKEGSSDTRIKNLMMFFNLLHSYETVCRPVCHRLNISQTALDILMFLCENPEYATAKDVSRFRAMKPNIVSFNVERLVEEGYHERSEVPGDRRKIRLSCTDKAREAVREGREISERFYKDITEGIKKEELEMFESCLKRIEDNAEHIRNRNQP